MKRSLRHRGPILLFLLPFAVGVVAGRIHLVELPAMALFGTAWAALIASCFLIRTAAWYATFSLTCVAGGLLYMEGRTARIPDWSGLPARSATLTVRVDRLFAPGRERASSSGLGTITQADPLLHDLTGQRLYFSAFRRPGEAAPVVSEILQLKGLLEPLGDAAPNTFDGFLLNAGVAFRLRRARVLAQVSPPTLYRQFCHRSQDHLGHILEQGLEHRPDLAGILKGMLLGQTSTLSEAQHQAFVRSGTLHVFSISGLHIAAIAVALHMLLTLLRVPGAARFVTSAALLWLYVDVTGSSPSAVRAFWMVILVEAAFLVRRPVNPVATLGFAAVVSLLADPRQLFSASFQMSYGIVAALLLLGLPLAETWQQRTALFRQLPRVAWSRWHKGADWLQRALTSSLGIGVATGLVSALAGVLYFQLVTPSSLLANLILIPIASLALWAGFLSLLFGLAGLSLVSSVFNHSAALLLASVTGSLEALVALPGSYVRAEFVHPSVGYAALGGLLLLILAGYAARWAPRFGGYWTPFIWTAGVLVFGVRYSGGG